MRHWVLNAKEYSSDDIEMQVLTIFVENREWRIYNVYDIILISSSHLML